MIRLMRRLRRLRAGRRGAATVELALIVPAFILMIFGLIEFGHVWYIWSAIYNASQEGARYALVYRNVPGTSTRMAPSAFSPSIPDVVDGYLLSFFPEKFWSVPAQADWSNNATGQPVTVVVTATKQWYVLGGLIGLAPLTISAKSVVRLE